MKRIVLAAFIVIAVLMLAACGGPREVLSAEEFTSRMGAEGYTVEDFTHYVADDLFIETFLSVDTGAFEVEFYVFESEEDAMMLFHHVRGIFEDAKGSTRSHTEVNIANFNRFRQTTDGRFEALTRVENTLVIVQSSSENRGDVNAIFDLLGY